MCVHVCYCVYNSYMLLYVYVPKYMLEVYMYSIFICFRYYTDDYYTNNTINSPHSSHLYHMHRGSSSRRHWSDNIKLRQIPLDLIHMPPLSTGTGGLASTTSNNSSSNIPQKLKSKGRSLVNSGSNIHRKLSLSQEEEEKEEEKKGSDNLSILEEGRQSRSTEAALLASVTASVSANSKSSDDAMGGDDDEDDERGVYRGISGDEYIEVKASDDIDDDDEEQEGGTSSGVYDSVGAKRYTPGTSSSTSSSGYSPLKAAYNASPILRKKKAAYQVSSYTYCYHSYRLVC